MAAKIEADMLRICEECRYIEDYDHVFTINEVVDQQNEKYTELSRSALTADGYKKEIKFIEIQTDNTFKHSDKGKKHCEELDARRIEVIADIFMKFCKISELWNNNNADLIVSRLNRDTRISKWKSNVLSPISKLRI